MWWRVCAVTVGLALVGAMGCGRDAAPPWARVVEATGPPRGRAARIVDAAVQAGRIHGVPPDLLVALGWHESRLRAAGAAQAGAPPLQVGPMGLRLGGTGATLQAAARAAGLPVDAVATQDTANVLAAAAWLRDHAGPSARIDELASWWEAVAAYSGLGDAEADAWTAEVFATLARGGALEVGDGTRIALRRRLPEGLRQRATAPPKWVPPSPDWGPAQYSPACSGNYTTASRGKGDIQYIVIHVTQGSYAGAIAWFGNCAAKVSAHYVIKSSNGAITQTVLEKDIAWHAGNWEYNKKSIGIEHEGWVDEPKWFTDAMYQASAKLVAALCDKYGIPKDKAHILGHKEVPGATHTDPGPNWDWNKYMALVQQGAPPPPPPPPPTGNLKGFVREDDIYTGKDIVGAKVVLDTGAQTTTGSNGLYLFEGLPPKTYTITASAPGYVTKTVTKDVQAGIDNWRSIALVKESPPPPPPPPPPQQGTITGHVRVGDEVQGPPLSGATVTLDGQQSTTSGADGVYVFEGVDVGLHTATASAAGFLEASLLVEVAAGQTTVADFGLEPAPPQPDAVDAVHVTDVALDAPVDVAPDGIPVDGALAESVDAPAVPEEVAPWLDGSPRPDAPAPAGGPDGAPSIGTNHWAPGGAGYAPLPQPAPAAPAEGLDAGRGDASGCGAAGGPGALPGAWLLWAAAWASRRARRGSRRR